MIVCFLYSLNNIYICYNYNQTWSWNKIQNSTRLPMMSLRSHHFENYVVLHTKVCNRKWYNRPYIIRLCIRLLKKDMRLSHSLTRGRASLTPLLTQAKWPVTRLNQELTMRLFLQVYLTLCQTARWRSPVYFIAHLVKQSTL